jgi:hypothetical protein
MAKYLLRSIVKQKRNLTKELINMANEYESWAYLNDEGKKLYGSVFPDGKVPIVSIIGFQAEIEGKDESVYLIRQEQITPEKLEALLTILAEKFKAPKKAIKEEMEKNRTPIRQKYTTGAGTTNIGMFLPDDPDEEYSDDDEFYDEEGGISYDDTGGYP